MSSGGGGIDGAPDGPCLGLLQGIENGGGLFVADVRQLIMSPGQLPGTLMAVAHARRWGAEVPMRYVLFQRFAREFLVPRLRTWSAEERAALFATVEQLLADGDVLIDDAVDNEVIDELVYVGHTLTDDPVDLTGAGPLTAERIDRSRAWRVGPESPPS